MKIHAMALLLALGLDLFFGDIERLPHPARWMGSLYRWFDEFFRKANWRRYETGLFAVIFTGAVFALGSALILTMIIADETDDRFRIFVRALYGCICFRSPRTPHYPASFILSLVLKSKHARFL